MQNKGTLTKWNDDRGFGFIKHSETEMLFIHISSVQLMPRRPKEGDILFYDIIQDSSGKKKAACVTIEGLQKVNSRTKNITYKKPSKFNSISIIFIIVFALLGYYVKTHYFNDDERNSPESFLSEKIQVIENKKVENHFVCQGKTHCSQMTSCEEAKFYLKNCPNQSTDGDGDGKPCENQWCN
ncbi:MAG TPA: excalibur calcium-binding domain-containing protein [Cellvibrio sp.]